MKQFVAKYSLELVLCLVFICLFNFPKFAPISLVLAVVWILVAAIRKQLVFTPNYPVAGFILLYAAYAIGIIWTKDMELSRFYLENKLSFVILPILFGFSKKSGFNLSIVLKGLILSVLIAFFWGIAKGIPCYLHYQSFPWCFMKSHLSSTVHPTYMAAGVQIAIVSVFLLLEKKELNKKVGVSIIILLIAYIFLLMSLSGVLFFLLLSAIYILFKIAQRKSRGFVVSIVIVLIAFLSGLFFFTPFLKKDLYEVEKNIQLFFSSQEQFVHHFPEEPSSSQVRLVLWLASIEEIQEHPMGVGTGNVDYYLGGNLKEKGLHELATHNYNPHNQFLHTWLEIGAIGFLILMYILVSGIRWGIKKKNILAIILFANLAFNCLFESMLQQQSGILFYPLLLMVIHIYVESEKKAHD